MMVVISVLRANEGRVNLCVYVCVFVCVLCVVCACVCVCVCVCVCPQADRLQSKEAERIKRKLEVCPIVYLHIHSSV